MSRLTADSLRVKRVYDPASRSDGRRVLVDRLWPRGLSKDKAAIDLWLRDLAPSTALRQWFDHEPSRWPAFRRRYAAELTPRRDALKHLRAMARQGRVTLLYAAHDETHNNANALRAVLLGR